MLALIALPVALVPLIVSPATLYPFVTGKAALLMLSAHLALALALWKRPLREVVPHTPVAAALVVVALAAAVSAALGRDLVLSVTDTPDRQMGLLATLHAALLYVGLRGLAVDEDTWTRWLGLALAGVVVASMLAAQQALDPAFLPAARQDGRLASTLGHATHLAGAALLGGTLAALLWGRVGRLARAAIAVAAIACLAALALADTRGATLGLVAALVLAPFLAALLGPERRARALALGGASLVAGAGLVALGVTGALRGVPGLGRLADAGAALGSGQARLLVWRAGLAAVRDRPLTGAGPSHFAAAIEPHHPVALVEHGWHETWFDDAHNVFINVLVEQGTFGLLAHLTLLGALVWTAWLTARRGALGEGLVLLAGLAALLVHRALAFDDHTTLALGALLAAFADRLPPDYDPRPSTLQRGLAVALPIAGVALWAPPVIALHHAAAHTEALERGATLAADEALSAACEVFPPYAPFTLSLATSIALERADELGRVAGPAALRAHLVRLADHLEVSLARHPEDVRAHLASAQLGARLFQRFADRARVKGALAHARRAVELSPRRREGIYLLASLLLETGAHGEGLALLRKSVEEMPAYGGGWWRLALAHEKLGHRGEARRLAREALARRVLLDEEGAAVLRRLAGAVSDRRSAPAP